MGDILRTLTGSMCEGCVKAEGLLLRTFFKHLNMKAGFKSVKLEWKE